MKDLLIRICCRWCNTTFLLCRSCYRGHVYCSMACRKAGRRKSLNEAQSRYRKTAKGKKSHSKSENSRRQKKNRPQVKNMDDQTTSSPENMSSKDVRVPISTEKCHFCGRLGTIVDVFPWREYKRRFRFDRTAPCKEN